MEGLVVVAVIAVYLSALVIWDMHNSKQAAALPAPDEQTPPPSSIVVLRQLQESPWTKLAKRQGWPLRSRQLDPRRSKLSIQWGSGEDALYLEVLLLHSEQELVTTTRFSMPCRRPSQGLIANRELMSQAMAWQGVRSGRRLASPWLSDLVGPQELSWESVDLLDSDQGRLHLTLPVSEGEVSQVRTGLRALRVAFQQARHPAWAGLAHEQGWSLSFDSTKTLPILAGTFQGVAFRATLRKAGRGLQTQVLSIDVPELLPELYITHSAHGSGASAQLNHPIADTMIHALSPHLPALRLLVNNPQVFGPLMAVVHAHPGSSLSGSRIELLSSGDLKLELLGAIEAVATLSQALREHYLPRSGRAD